MRLDKFQERQVAFLNDYSPHVRKAVAGSLVLHNLAVPELAARVPLLWFSETQPPSQQSDGGENSTVVIPPENAVAYLDMFGQTYPTYIAREAKALMKSGKLSRQEARVAARGMVGVSLMVQESMAQVLPSLPDDAIIDEAYRFALQSMLDEKNEQKRTAYLNEILGDPT